MMLAVTVVGACWALPAGAATSRDTAPPAPQQTVNSVLPGPLGASAEATAVIDPAHRGRMAVAQDPYLDTTHIQVSVSSDGGARWSAAINVLPPGMVKSYDPQLAFAADGSLLVVGGASPDRHDDCQGQSVIFVASVRGSQVTYRTVAAAPAAGGLLDRPTFVLDPARQQIVVAWTASPGAAASCRLRPESSTTWVARLTTALQVTGAEALPKAAQAPFGSSLAVNGDGTVGLVVAARNHADALDIVVYRCTDAVHWSTATVGHGQAQADSLPGLGGAVLSMPTITGLAHGFAVAWTDAGSGRARTRLALDRGGGWTEIPAPGVDTSTSTDVSTLLPTVAANGGRLLLEQASRTPAGIRFDSWQQLDGLWFETASDAAGPVADRHELGEALGLAAAPAGGVLTAVPMDTATGSALLVRTYLPPPPATAGPAAALRPAPAKPGAGAPSWLLPALAVVGVALLLLSLRRRRFARRGRGAGRGASRSD